MFDFVGSTIQHKISLPTLVLEQDRCALDLHSLLSGVLKHTTFSD